MIAPENLTEIRALDDDAGEWLSYVRVVGRRRAGAASGEPILAIPAQYEKKRMLREPD
jgi:hypothetical protein